MHSDSSDNISYSVMELKSSLDDLVKASNELRAYILDRRSAEFYLAPRGNFDFSLPYELMADTLCNLTYQPGRDLTQPNGLLLIDDEGEMLANSANIAKSYFFTIASHFNKVSSGAKKGLAQTKGRADILKDAFAGMGYRQLWMQQCYRKIQILNREPKRISFTWQREHTSRKLISLEDALSMCADAKGKTELERDEWAEMVRSVDMKRFNLVVVKSKSQQLKANVTYTRGTNKASRDRFSSPTIILLNGEKLPIIKYSDPDQQKKRTVRSDKVLRADYKLGFLNLYKMPKREEILSGHEDENIVPFNIKDFEEK